MISLEVNEFQIFSATALFLSIMLPFRFSIDFVFQFSFHLPFIIMNF